MYWEKTTSPFNFLLASNQKLVALSIPGSQVHSRHYLVSIGTETYWEISWISWAAQKPCVSAGSECWLEMWQCFVLIDSMSTQSTRTCVGARRQTLASRVSLTEQTGHSTMSDLSGRLVYLMSQEHLSLVSNNQGQCAIQPWAPPRQVELSRDNVLYQLCPGTRNVVVVWYLEDMGWELWVTLAMLTTPPEAWSDIIRPTLPI